MSISNFIYSIEDIYTKCLDKHKTVGYYIAPYQRGYKWRAKTTHDPIPVLLSDLYEAFIKSKQSNTSKEYYLQYITIKKTLVNNQYYFEVIDGQQRLTTLTILFKALEKYNIPNITRKDNNEYALSYARYENEENNIFDVTASLEQNLHAHDFEEQDRFYLYKAYHCIISFFEILNKHNSTEFIDFTNYLRNDVKIILNKEDDYTIAEEVFASLNANKVPLTNSYLIKGLLLTKASRNISTSQKQKHFKEIMDERAIMGRTWDEMNSWFSTPKISTFFFGVETEGMEQMLKLVEFEANPLNSNVIALFRETLEKESKTSSTDYDLFNKYLEYILTPEDSAHYLKKIKHIYKRLKSWFHDDETYNLVGYRLHTINDSLKLSIVNNLLKLEHDELLNTLHRYIVDTLPDKEGILKLSYDNKNKHQDIKNLLLALSIFSESNETKLQTQFRYDFYNHHIENWSLEHIFPQTPDGKKYNVGDDKDWVLIELGKTLSILESQKLDENSEAISNLKNTIHSVSQGNEVIPNELKTLFDSIVDIHNLGNMALLSSSVNSALKNGFFNTKRKILLSKINKGSFVPKHTIDVFSKMLELPSDSSKSFIETLTIWGQEDIDAHYEWIETRIETLKTNYTL